MQRGGLAYGVSDLSRVKTCLHGVVEPILSPHSVRRASRQGKGWQQRKRLFIHRGFDQISKYVEDKDS